MMKLTDWMDPKGLCVGIILKDKEGIIDILAALQQKCGNTDQGRRLKQDVYYREEEAPSAIGAGVAICQVRSDAVKRPLITAVTVPGGVDLDAPDGEKSRLIFLAALPPEQESDPFSRLTVLLMNEDLREQLIVAADEQTFLQLLRLAEQGCYGTPAAAAEEAPLILAVLREEDASTEAAAHLQLAAGRLGMLLKTERCSGENSIEFTEEDIREAKGVLLMGDGLLSNRFDGKPVLEFSVSDGIHRPEHLLKSVLHAPVFRKKIVRRPPKARLSDWYYRSNVPLLPLLLLTGGTLLFIGQICGLFVSAQRVGEALTGIGERTLLLLLPRISGMLGFRYARWPGLAVGLIGGVLLESFCGGVWAALLGGAATGFLMRWLERRISRFPVGLRWTEWFAPVVGVGVVGCLAFLMGLVADWVQKGFLQLASVLGPRWQGFLFSAAAGLDPAGPLNRAALSVSDAPQLTAALAAGGLALALGLSSFSFLRRRALDPIHRANGWAALPSGLCGSIGSYIVFYAGDPFRIFLAGAAGSGAAGLLSASLGCEADRQGIFALLSCNRIGYFLLSVLCGAALCCALLWLLRSHVNSTEDGAHEGKKEEDIF